MSFHSHLIGKPGVSRIAVLQLTPLHLFCQQSGIRKVWEFAVPPPVNELNAEAG